MSRIISFLGADHKAGTTMLAQCTAEYASKNIPMAEILLIHANGRESCDYSEGFGYSIEQISPYLEKGNADMSEIYERSLWKGNLHVIGGFSGVSSSDAVHPDAAASFLQDAGDYFDLIICDCGADLSHGLALGCTVSSDHLELVMSQGEICLRMLDKQRKLLSELSLEDYGIVINSFDSSSPYSKNYVTKRCGLAPCRVISVRASEYGALAESEGISLLCMQGGGFKKDIAKLAEEVIRGTEIGPL